MNDSKRKKLPDGWRWIQFPECIINKSANITKIPEKNYLKEGIYPIIDQGANYIAGYTNDGSFLYKHDFPVIVFGDHTRIFKFVDFNFAIGADGTKIIHPNLEIVHPKYFYYTLKDADFPDDGYNRHYKYLKFVNILIPPMLNDQIRIANELERKMTEVEKMRQSALRQKEAISDMQNAVLREAFPWKDGDKLPDGWRWTSLKDNSLITLIMGQSPPSETYNKNGQGLPFFQGKADFGITHPIPSVWCSVPNRIAEPNDILLSIRAPVGPTNITDRECCIGRGLAAIRCKKGLSYKYLILILRHFEKKISLAGTGSTFNAIGKDEIKSIEFPLPPTLDDQIKIANDLEHKMDEIEKMRNALDRQLEAIKALPGAILREVFDFDPDSA
jgi:type I restriction enzyme S subunit